MRRNRLSNMNLRNFRNDLIYQAVVTDLYLHGVISKEKAEEILGYEIPKELKKAEWPAVKPAQAQATHTDDEGDSDDESGNESDDSQ